MILLGVGLGLSSAPATESIMGVVRPDQAGVGSAVNDATRMVGGTLGVAIIGSVYASYYRHALAHLTIPAGAREAARSSYALTRRVAGQLSPHDARTLLTQADHGFLQGLHAGCAVAAAVCALGAVLVLAYLPAHPSPPTADNT